MKKDFIIVGSGISGLSAAFFAGQKGSVTLITKGFDLRISKSFSRNDGVLFSKNLDILRSDILKSTNGLAFDNDKMDFFIDNVNGAFYFLRDVLGIKFSNKAESIFGYSEGSVFFKGEKTGGYICEKLIEQIEQNSNIEIVLDTNVSELIYESIENRESRKDFIGGKKVTGVVGEKEGNMRNYLGTNVLLATGAGDGMENFEYLGDGIRMAKSVGAEIKGMNNVTWNPLSFYLESVGNYFLPFEILNHGAFLVNEKGEKFVDIYLEGKKDYFLGDLSEICFYDARRGEGVKYFLDMRHKSNHFWEEKFPELYYLLKTQGFDISKSALPLKNIQYHLVGGVSIGENCKTTVSGLYVNGELSNFGVIGSKWMPGIGVSSSIILAKSFADNAVL